MCECLMGVTCVLILSDFIVLTLISKWTAFFTRCLKTFCPTLVKLCWAQWDMHKRIGKRQKGQSKKFLVTTFSFHFILQVAVLTKQLIKPLYFEIFSTLFTNEKQDCRSPCHIIWVTVQIHHT